MHLQETLETIETQWTQMRARDLNIAKGKTKTFHWQQTSLFFPLQGFCGTLPLHTITMRTVAIRTMELRAQDFLLLNRKCMVNQLLKNKVCVIIQNRFVFTNYMK